MKIPSLNMVCAILASLCLTVLAACSDSGHTYRIGVSQCSNDDWRAKMNDEITREAMFHNEVEVEIRSADDSNDKQIADIRYFMDNDFDAIVVSPNEAEPLTPIVREAYEKGIPVIIFDRNIVGDSYTAYLGIDNEEIGRAAARYARNLTGANGRALEIYGLPGSTPADGRHKGFSDEFLPTGGTILASVPGNWRQEDAEAVVDSLLRIYNNVDLIYAHNDRMAIGAAEVARRLGRDSIRIIGIDAAPTIGVQAVADSVIDATFLYPTEGQRVIRTALDILEGRPYQRTTILPASSAVDLSNADILLLQNETLSDETDKLRQAKIQIDDYLERYTSQTTLFYACLAIIVLLFGVIFLVLRTFWQHRRHQETLMAQNRELEQQRDLQRDLNRKLEEATHAKLVFFTNVSHDLRTPLTLIAEPIARLTTAHGLSDSERVLVKIADKNVRILHRLINQILDFRKYENGKLNIHLTEVDMDALLGEWLESFTSLARRRNIKLKSERLEGSTESAVMAVDAEKIERVVFNLLSNAFKYTPDNGSVTVTYGAEGGNFVIRVADTGEGISEQDLGNIFDRFYQVDRVHPKGSGIGLSLSKAFIEMHDGTITVESEPGKGSVFTVTLPVRHVAEAAVEAEKYISADQVTAELDVIEDEVVYDESKPLVLVIDDNRDVRLLISELVGDRYNVISALNGAEGIRKAVKYVPDLIVCDVMMPVMDGLECCRRLKTEVITSHIPVLMLTACSMDEQRVQGYESGADGYLAKPFNIEVLRARIASMIENHKRLKSLTAQNTVSVSPAKPEESRRPKTGTGDIDSDFYNRFLDIFTPEMGNPDLNINTIAGKLGLERTQFYRKIKALTNYSPVELMRHLRLKEARRLLTSTEMSISEIAYATGFSTPAYFTKCYRDAYAETPSDTRSHLKMEN